MKTLPVIQPTPKTSENAADARAANEGGRPQQTADMVDDPDQSATLKPRIIKAVSTVFDPEIPVNIYDLGLIYDVIVDASRRVGIRMTLTAPACPAAQFLPDRVKKAVEAVPEVTDVAVDVVWEPPWSRDRMSDAAKLQLGFF
jgi:FeS assembly SUF system protein